MADSSYPRDLVGYGRTIPQVRWPGDARIAVQFVLNYEEGGESSILDGDTASESLLSEIVGAQPWPGQRNLNMESIYEYGSRAGFWRLWRLLTEPQDRCHRLWRDARHGAQPRCGRGHEGGRLGDRQPRLSLAGIQGFFGRGGAQAHPRSGAPAQGTDRFASAWHVSGQAIRQYAEAGAWRRAASSIPPTTMPTICPIWVPGLTKDKPHPDHSLYARCQ